MGKISIKYLLIISISLPFYFFSQNKKNKLPYFFGSLKYDKVTCFECNSNVKGVIVTNDGTINNKIVVAGKDLTQPQIDSLSNKFIRKILPVDHTLQKDCLFSDVAFVYYLKDQIVAYFTISKFCNTFWIYNIKPGPEKTVSFYTVSFKESDRKELLFICSELGLNCGH